MYIVYIYIYSMYILTDILYTAPRKVASLQHVAAITPNSNLKGLKLFIADSGLAE